MSYEKTRQNCEIKIIELSALIHKIRTTLINCPGAKVEINEKRYSLLNVPKMQKEIKEYQSILNFINEN